MPETGENSSYMVNYGLKPVKTGQIQYKQVKYGQIHYKLVKTVSNMPETCENWSYMFNSGLQPSKLVKSNINISNMGNSSINGSKPVQISLKQVKNGPTWSILV